MAERPRRSRCAAAGVNSTWAQPRLSAFKLRIPEAELTDWADRYSRTEEETQICDVVAPAVKTRGYLTRDEFLQLCHWKTRRSQPRCASNRAALVEEITRIALAASSEELKIGALLLLSGVSWPTASVILHFGDRANYPIIDYRALWSLSSATPSQYTFPFWWAYVCFIRDLHERTGLPTRTLDRALWQFSKEHQR